MRSRRIRKGVSLEPLHIFGGGFFTFFTGLPRVLPSCFIFEHWGTLMALACEWPFCSWRHPSVRQRGKNPALGVKQSPLQLARQIYSFPRLDEDAGRNTCFSMVLYSSVTDLENLGASHQIFKVNSILWRVNSFLCLVLQLLAARTFACSILVNIWFFHDVL